eukprot:m.134322 g.134322  ORF g.134322 m.134322 type:complete len:69 (+) comp13862_c0_seq1:568-774(+)
MRDRRDGREKISSSTARVEPNLLCFVATFAVCVQALSRDEAWPRMCADCPTNQPPSKHLRGIKCQNQE